MSDTPPPKEVPTTRSPTPVAGEDHAVTEDRPVTAPTIPEAVEEPTSPTADASSVPAGEQPTAYVAQDEQAPITETEAAPVTEGTPVSEPAPAAEETPATEPAPVTEDTSVSEPAPAAEETPATEPAPVTEDTSVSEPAPAAEETPTTEAAPATEAVSPTEEEVLEGKESVPSAENAETSPKPAENEQGDQPPQPEEATDAPADADADKPSSPLAGTPAGSPEKQKDSRPTTQEAPVSPAGEPKSESPPEEGEATRVDTAPTESGQIVDSPTKEPTSEQITEPTPPSAEPTAPPAEEEEQEKISPPATAQSETSTALPTTAQSGIRSTPSAAKNTRFEAHEPIKDSANIITGNALSMVWSFGLNKNIPMINLTTEDRSVIFYTCAHTGICYNVEDNTQKLLQGHNNNISAVCASDDKRWLATADKGPNSMIIIWDMNTFFPVQTIFETGDDGVVAMALTPDARYLVTISAGAPQVLSIWDWTTECDKALCSATLDPSYGTQSYVLFNPDDTTQIVSNSDYQVIFYAWNEGKVEYYCPPLTDEDFNKPVGKYTQSIFMENSNKCLTATSIGNLVVWDSNKPLTKVVSRELTPNKKALKLVRVQDRGINVLMTSDSHIVMGDMTGHVKIFDQSLNLVHWYQDLHVGPINAISFTYIEKWGLEMTDQRGYPADASLSSQPLPLRDFAISSTHSVYAMIQPRGTDINVILRNHDAPVHAITTHPTEKRLYIGSYSGLLQVWDYESRTVVASRRFDKGYMIQCVTIDPRGSYLGVGFTNGVVKVLDASNLLDETNESFRYARDTITHIQFSHDSRYLATADGEFTTTLFKFEKQPEVGYQWTYVGRHKAHYKKIKDLSFGKELDTDIPRLLTLGEDRKLVEYDLLKSTKDNLIVMSLDRIEQSAIPQCLAWYPPLNKEHFIVTANDQYKFKLYNVTTKRCRKTVLGPTYGSPLKKICILPTKDDRAEKMYLAYINQDKVGLHILPLDGNPHNSMALVAHPAGVSAMAVSSDGQYIFTAGGSDTCVQMWYINTDALEAQSQLGGEDLIPFYGLLEGGREGEMFAELEDYFYYAQLRHQGIDTMMARNAAVKIALSEVPYVMRAMGFYPSEQEIEDMLNEVKFSRYVETGEDVTNIDLGDFIKLYINHRPAFGLSLDKIGWCFDVLGVGNEDGESTIKRGQLLDMLQRSGEHMTEYELSEYLTTLLGANEEGGSCEGHSFNPEEASNVIIDNIPVDITNKAFTDDLLGFGVYSQPDILTLDEV